MLPRNDAAVLAAVQRKGARGAFLLLVPGRDPSSLPVSPLVDSRAGLLPLCLNRCAHLVGCSLLCLPNECTATDAVLLGGRLARTTYARVPLRCRRTPPLSGGSGECSRFAISNTRRETFPALAVRTADEARQAARNRRCDVPLLRRMPAMRIRAAVNELSIAGGNPHSCTTRHESSSVCSVFLDHDALA
ncbi:hypothetical protein MRX96_009717 [Rhipicephalus microplus]